MSLPHLFTLSTELLIEIISNLCLVDIYACQCTCRRLNGVIVNSHLIQYIMRAALSGVFDPLESGLSLPDRLDALERWETAWMEIDLRGPNSIITIPAESVVMPGRGLLSGQYLIMCQDRIGASASYSYLDIHAWSSHTDAADWTTIEIGTPILTSAFASELNLAVVILVPTFIDMVQPEKTTTVTISLLQFGTGEPHPLASQPRLEVSISGAAAYNLSDTIVIGDYVLYWVGAPHDNVRGSLCGIYLIAWKEGWVSELCTSLPGVYSSALSVLSEEIILLVRLREPALELCRLSHINDREKASLETVCILSLPVLTARTSFWWAVCFDDPGHVPFSKNHQRYPSLHPRSSSSGLSTKRPEGRTDTRHRLYPVSEDGIIVVLMYLSQLYGNSCMFDLTMRRRTLLDLSGAQAQAGAAGTGTGTGVGTVLAVPWEKWGPNKTRLLEHNSSLCGGSLAGERRATVLRTRIATRDYNLFRVQRALKLFGGAEKGVTLENGTVVTVVKGPSISRGGEWFRDDIKTSLPYVDTVAPCEWCNEILMDKDNLVVVRTSPGLGSDFTQPGELKFYLHSL